MSKIRNYGSARAFSQALDQRLRSFAKEQGGYDIARIRRQVAFDRLLARLFAGKPAAWVLKGGYAMELRVDQARATRDVDLALPNGLEPGSSDDLGFHLHRELQRQAEKDLGDFFEFLISEPIADLEAAPYGGARFHVEARLDGRSFARFHLDVGVGDVILEPLDFLKDRGWLAFAGHPPVSYPALSKEQQVAEKVHAFTLPREEGRPNSRVKDLIDLVLLIQDGSIDRSRLRKALNATFQRRGTHTLPREFPDPPSGWEKPFKELAEEVSLGQDLESAILFVRNFYASFESGE